MVAPLGCGWCTGSVIWAAPYPGNEDTGERHTGAGDKHGVVGSRAEDGADAGQAAGKQQRVHGAAHDQGRAGPQGATATVAAASVVGHSRRSARAARESLVIGA